MLGRLEAEALSTAAAGGAERRLALRARRRRPLCRSVVGHPRPDRRRDRSTTRPPGRLRGDFDALHERTLRLRGERRHPSRRSISPSASRRRARVPRSRRRTGWLRTATPTHDSLSIPVPAGHRPAYVDAATGIADVAVFHVADLREGDILVGPALIDAEDSTTFVARGFTCRVGPYRVLHLVAD